MRSPEDPRIPLLQGGEYVNKTVAIDTRQALLAQQDKRNPTE